MSTLSTFLDPRPHIGELIYLVDSPSNNPTIAGKEFLRSAVLKSITGYEARQTDTPWMTLNVGADKATLPGSARTTLLATNGYYYQFGGTAPNYSTDLLTWTACLTDLDTQCLDAFVWGNYVIHLTPSNTVQYYLLAAAQTAITTTIAQYCGAVNAAGTLGVMCYKATNTAGFIYTATVATTWTSRTPTAITAAPFIYFAKWVNGGTVFGYITDNAHLLTTPDGYTLTDRGVLITGATIVAGAPTTATIPGFQGAASATATIFILSMTVNGLLETYLVRITNATTWTCVLLSSVIPADAGVTGIPRVAYLNGVWYIYGPSVVTNTRYFYYHTSGDDGVTWVKAPLPLNPTAATGLIIGLGYGNAVNFSYASGSGASATTHASAFNVATHVGIPLIVSFSNTNIYPGYVRIK